MNAERDDFDTISMLVISVFGTCVSRVFKLLSRYLAPVSLLVSSVFIYGKIDQQSFPEERYKILLVFLLSPISYYTIL